MWWSSTLAQPLRWQGARRASRTGCQPRPNRSTPGPLPDRSSGGSRSHSGRRGDPRRRSPVRPGSIAAMILSDVDIRKEIESGRIVIDPFESASIQPSSVDLHVDDRFRVFANSRYPYIDVKKEMPGLTEVVEVADPDPFILHPGEFVLGSTLGRLGLLIHSTAGYVDPGWDGYLTLELSNVANLPITIYPGMKIGQISFFRLTTAADRPYGSKDRGSKYQGQRGPTASRFFEEFLRESESESDPA